MKRPAAVDLVSLPGPDFPLPSAHPEDILTAPTAEKELVKLDIRAHLQNANYPTSVKVKRLCWGLLQPLFRLSPRPFYGFRNALLRWMGAKIGQSVMIYPQATITFPWNVTIGDWVVIGPEVAVYALSEVSIGSNVLISQGAHLCSGSHDIRRPNFPLKCRPIVIHDETWICAEAFIGPGITLGPRSIAAARAVVVKNVEPYAIVGGSPAQVISYWT